MIGLVIPGCPAHHASASWLTKTRWWRRVIGYGIGVGTGYQRINHDAHWLSDTIAGAAMGIWAAKFVMKRRASIAPRGEVSLLPLDGGAMLTYTVPIR